MPAGDKKYLLLAKRRLVFTSWSVAVPFFCSLTKDDRWYNVPRRPLTGLKPVPVLPSLLLTVATTVGFLEANILKKVYCVRYNKDKVRFTSAGGQHVPVI